MKKSLLVLAALGLLLMPSLALADSISPSAMTFYGTPGEPFSVLVNKRVTVTKGLPTAANADIFLMSDTTGSMFTLINNAKAGAADIVTKTTGIGGGTTNWAVGSYKDFPTNPWGSPGDYQFRLDTALTGTGANVVAGINTWSASGGNDLPESNLYALQQAAATSWRAGSARFIVQFGDAWGHDPDVAGDNNLGYPGPNLATTTAALVANNVKLLAVDLAEKDYLGQETHMANATGGAVYDGYSGAIADFIKAAIEESFAKYSTVSLDFSGLPTGVSFIPVDVSESGDFTREEDRFFDFSFYLIGCCTAIDKPFVDFEINALVDGAVVATEYDRIICETTVPVPGSLLFLGTGLIGLLGLRRRL